MARYLEYTSAAVPKIKKLLPECLSIIDNKMITTPNLNARYLSLKKDHSLDHDFNNATSNVFYVIKGSGKTKYNYNYKNETIFWSEGDVFTLPNLKNNIIHSSDEIDSVLFYASDKPLMDYLKCEPTEPRFNPMFYPKREMMAQIDLFNNEEGAENRNRNGVLLTSDEMINEKLNTLTHTMWSLMNSISPNTIQKPHKHNSIAIDLCVDINQDAEDKEEVYTLMGEELNENNEIINPVKMIWKKGCTFTTPPGWWHSHHNESSYPAWVFPVQDAGLHTYMRTLDIKFVN